MNLLKKILLKLKIEGRFFLEQEWGIKKPTDSFAISKSILKKYLPVDPIIIDCGAHVGSDSIELARIFPKGRVYAIEPVPQIFHHLKNNTRRIKNIVCQKIALGDSNGDSEMYVSSGASNASSSLLKPTGHLVNHPNVNFNEKITVETRTLDYWCELNDIANLDFLWLDMQGYELNMLQASPKMLKTVKLIYTEVSLTDTYLNAPLYHNIKEWLNHAGFDVVLEIIPEKSDMGNVLFLRRNEQ